MNINNSPSNPLGQPKHTCSKGADRSAPFGVLLCNLGSPDAPTANAVRRYLREFLSDRRVVDMARWLWWPILHGIILRFRPARLAKLYQSVWLSDSPLRVYSNAQADKLHLYLQRAYCQPIPVAVAMNYGSPSLRTGLLQLRQDGVKRVLVLPLYPQYSCSTTASIFDRVADALSQCRCLPELRFVYDYHADAGYIDALAASVRAHWQINGRAQRLLISFHGLPQRYVDEGDPYALQCESTARRLASALNLQEDEWQLCFQSRFGREPWLQPYLDQILQRLPAQNIKTVAIICPGFASDCLETLEEIRIRSRAQFIAEGGHELRYIPALNANDEHIQALTNIIKQATIGW